MTTSVVSGRGGQQGREKKREAGESGTGRLRVSLSRRETNINRETDGDTEQIFHLLCGNI